MKTFKSYINESSLSRVFKFWKEYETGTISAFRSARDCNDGARFTKRENLDNSAKLKMLLLANKYGVTKIAGVYIENYGTDKEIPVDEDAYLVVNLPNDPNFKKKMIMLGNKFEQDSITYSKPGGDYYIISTNTCKNGHPGKGKIGLEMKLGDPMFGRDGEFHSRIRNRPFVFMESTSAFASITDEYPTHIRSIVNSIIAENTHYISPAYWIDSSGNIIAPEIRHIGSVIKHPEFFGETIQSIKDTFSKHNEPITPTIEGKAREEIMLRVLQRGFIRIREVRNKWSVETWILTDKLKDALWWWAKNVAADKNHKYDDVFVHELKTNKMEQMTIKKLVENLNHSSIINHSLFLTEEQISILY